MYMLCIQHKVTDYEGWKEAFDSKPVGRRESGVRRYQILRPVDDPNFVMIDLELDSAPEAEALLAAMGFVWGNVEGTVMSGPEARIAEKVETRQL